MTAIDLTPADLLGSGASLRTLPLPLRPRLTPLQPHPVPLTSPHHPTPSVRGPSGACTPGGRPGRLGPRPRPAIYEETRPVPSEGKRTREAPRVGRRGPAPAPPKSGLSQPVSGSSSSPQSASASVTPLRPRRRDRSALGAPPPFPGKFLEICQRCFLRRPHGPRRGVCVPARPRPSAAPLRRPRF